MREIFSRYKRLFTIISAIGGENPKLLKNSSASLTEDA